MQVDFENFSLSSFIKDNVQQIVYYILIGIVLLIVAIHQPSNSDLKAVEVIARKAAATLAVLFLAISSTGIGFYLVFLLRGNPTVNWNNPWLRWVGLGPARAALSAAHVNAWLFIGIGLWLVLFEPHGRWLGWFVLATAVLILFVFLGYMYLVSRSLRNMDRDRLKIATVIYISLAIGCWSSLTLGFTT